MPKIVNNLQAFKCSNFKNHLSGDKTYKRILSSIAKIAIIVYNLVMKKKVEIYTDGACSGNPGIGGWGVVMLYKSHRKEVSGAEQSTTNNRMELNAIIQGLKLLKEPCTVTIYSDSAYSVEPFLQGWINGWIMRGWRTASKDEVKNVDLWKELLSLMQIHEVSFVKVKGHADNELNNRCDALARGAIKELQKSLPIPPITPIPDDI